MKHSSLLPGFKLAVLLVSSCAALSAPAIHVSWRPNPEHDVQYYGVYRASSMDVETKIANVSAAESVYLDDDIELGYVYYYRIVAVDSAHNVSEFSDPVHILADIPSSAGAAASLPTTFALQQNYPNPFNPTTTFTYAVPERANISLVIFDVLGRKIRSLISESKAPGTYNIQWDARDDAGNAVPTGLYFARFIGKDYTEVRRLVLKK
ncbi:T9SS type A sorting domain-containing protein [candidate division KSB1 bacterium]|nr:T9SS type A sorting domain-containing protein [candidate division KSB1 bacterium]